MPTSKTSGTQAATISTEHTLATISEAGTYVLAVDTGALALGDVLELRVKTKVRAGDTSRTAYFATFAHAQGDPNKYSIPIPITDEVVFTLKQVSGVGRSFPWNVIAL